MMEQIWWNHIIKVHSFLESIVTETVKGSSMLLSLPNSIPWRNTLIDIVSDRLRIENSKNKFEGNKGDISLWNELCSISWKMSGNGVE